MCKTETKGNIIIEDIKVGDIHYEYEHGFGIKSIVLTKPSKDKNGFLTWTSENLTSGDIITYSVNQEYIQYSPNLYDYEAYQVKFYI